MSKKPLSLAPRARSFWRNFKAVEAAGNIAETYRTGRLSTIFAPQYRVPSPFLQNYRANREVSSRHSPPTLFAPSISVEIRSQTDRLIRYDQTVPGVMRGIALGEIPLITRLIVGIRAFQTSLVHGSQEFLLDQPSQPNHRANRVRNPKASTLPTFSHRLFLTPPGHVACDIGIPGGRCLFIRGPAAQCVFHD